LQWNNLPQIWLKLSWKDLINVLIISWTNKRSFNISILFHKLILHSNVLALFSIRLIHNVFNMQFDTALNLVCSKLNQKYDLNSDRQINKILSNSCEKIKVILYPIFFNWYMYLHMLRTFLENDFFNVFIVLLSIKSLFKTIRLFNSLIETSSPINGNL
jgi:hypothetical protein